jgi:hypothetical protein
VESRFNERKQKLEVDIASGDACWSNEVNAFTLVLFILRRLSTLDNRSGFAEGCSNRVLRLFSDKLHRIGFSIYKEFGKKLVSDFVLEREKREQC